jgi:signal transduction histidine kinase/CheY-like chemotaxis protein
MVVHPMVVLSMGLVAGIGLAAAACCYDRRAKKRLHALRKQCQAAQQDAARARRMSAQAASLLATMSHEIRTPLNGMIGTTELLLESPVDAHQKWQLKTVMHSAEALLHIINDVLDYSKMESGKLLLQEERFSPHQLLELVAYEFMPKLRGSRRDQKLEMIVSCDEWLPAEFMGDAQRIRQILVNLVGNAVKFTAAGHIMLHAEPLHWHGGVVTGLRLIVSDTGIGIAADRHEAVFEKFVQERDGATTRDFGGSGLGLAICRELAHLMSGNIRLESAEGKGSVFTVELPIRHVPEADATSVVPVAYAGRRALIVENTEPCATLLRGYLAELGIRSFVGEDIATAVDTLRCAHEAGMPMDYVFIESQLADGDGVEALEKLKHAAESLPVKWVGMSLSDDADKARAFAQHGGHAFLRKPILRPHMAQLLESLETPQGGFLDTLHFHGEAEPSVAQAYPDYREKTVLLVEDNRVNREMALEMLAKFGIQAECAEHGRAAIDMMATSRFDLVLMDCQMPVMDGFTASRLLRQSMQAGDTPATPIIALTANAMRGDRERCLEAGMDDYLGKPLRMQDMQKMLARWFASTHTEPPHNKPQEIAA